MSDSAERFRRPRPAAQRAGRGRLIALALGLVLAALLGWAVVKVSAADALAEAGPAAAAMIAPDHPGAALERAHDELRLTGGLSAETRAAAEAAFARAPLSEVPMLAAARAAMARGDGRRTDRLLAEALRRNPRSRYGLLLRLERAVRLGRNDEAATTMVVLSRLFADVGAALVSQIAAMAADPSTRAAARHVMTSDPQVKQAVLERLARAGTDPELVLELAGPVRPAPAGAEPPAWQRLLLERMVERGRLAQAREIWAQLAGAATDAGGVYDPGFTGLAGPPPFNWRFESGGDGFAEPVRGAGGLSVEYPGRAQAVLASQLVLLAPGRYDIAFEAEGRADGEDSRLVWTLSCHGDDRLLVEVPITGVEFTPKDFQASFTVPAGCSGQWLRLTGRSAEYPEDQRVTIRALRLARAGS